MAIPLRKNKVLASNLYVLWLLVTVSSCSFFGITHPERVDQLSLVVGLLVSAMCLVAIGYYIRQGTAWASVLFILYTAWSTCQTVIQAELSVTVSAAAMALSIGISAIVLQDLLIHGRAGASTASVAEDNA